MKQKSWLAILAFVFLATACHEKIDTTARYVFKENTIISYLEKHKEDYGAYLDILYRVPVSTVSATTLGQLLSARGH